MADVTFKKIVFTLERKFAKIMDLIRGFKTVGIVTIFALISKLTCMNVTMTLCAILDAKLIFKANVALITLQFVVLTC